MNTILRKPLWTALVVSLTLAGCSRQALKSSGATSQSPRRSIAEYLDSIQVHKAYPALVQPIFNREYVPALHEALQNAQKSIHIFIFTFRYYPNYPHDANSVIIGDLIAAKQRGVEVKVIMDCSSWNRSNTLKNKMVGDSLKKVGIEVYYDPVDITSHDKLVIVDDSLVFVGSHNWSYFALERNNEASVKVVSKEVARAYEEHFQTVLRLSTEEVPDYLLPR